MRSRADLATFRLSGCAHDPAGIRHAATLEIVEVTPGSSASSAPMVGTLTYPISIDLVRADTDRGRVHNAPPHTNDGHGNDAGAGADAGPCPGRGRPRRRGRKRRRTATAQDGRADGMAVDAAGWKDSSGWRRADGVAITAGWASVCVTRDAQTPPPAVPSTDRCMDAWPPARDGGHPPRHKAKRGKRGGKKKRARIAAALAKFASAADPRPTTPLQRTGAHNAGPSGSLPTPDAGPAMPQVHTSPSGQLGTDAGLGMLASNRCASGDLDDLPSCSEVPDSQPEACPTAPEADPLSGQSGASPASAAGATACPADRST